MAKNRIRLTENNLRYVIYESVRILIKENNLRVIDARIKVLNTQLDKLNTEHKETQRELNNLRKIAKTVPEEAHMLQGEIDDLIKKNAEIASKKNEIRAKIREAEKERAQLTSPIKRKPAQKEVEPIDEPEAKPAKPKKSWMEPPAEKPGRMKYLNKAKQLYNNIMETGSLLIPRGAKVHVRGERRKVEDISWLVGLLEKFLSIYHPDKEVKYHFKKRDRRDYRQLDDTEIYDLDVRIVDKGSTSSNRIEFSQDDAELYDTSSY